MNNRHTVRNSFFARCAQALAAKRKQAAKAAPGLSPIVEPLEQRYAPAAVVTGTLTQSHSGSDVAPGDVIHYTEVVTNLGSDDALNVVIQHQLDANAAVLPGSVNVSPLALDDHFATPAETPFAVGPTTGLFSNDHEFLGDTFTLKVADSTSANGGTVMVNANGGFTYMPRPGFTGVDTFTYTITDDGTDGTDSLTSTGTVTIHVGGTASPSAGEVLPASSGLGDIHIGTLPAGKSVTINFSTTVANPLSAGVYQVSQQGVISGTNFLPVKTDDLSVLGSEDATVTHITAAPDLKIVSVSDGRTSVNPGEELTYTINYANVGNHGATGVVLTETLPTGTSIDLAQNPGWHQVGNTDQYTYNVGNLAATGSGSVEFIVRVIDPAVAGLKNLSSTVSIADDHANGADMNPGDNTASDSNTALLAAPDLAITSVVDGKTSAAPGDTVSYTINYANLGNQNATGVVITETLPAGTHFDSSLNPGWSQIGSSNQYAYHVDYLGSKVSGSVTFHVTVDDPVVAGLEHFTNNVSIADDGFSGADSNHLNDSKSDTNDLDATPDLSVVVTSSTPVNVTVDDTIDYTISYANAAGAHNQNASGVHLHFKLPAGTSIDLNDAANTGWTLVGGTTDEYEYAVGSDVVAGAAPGTAGLKLHVNSTAAAGQDDIKLEVSIADDNAGGADSNLLDNTASATHVLDAAPELQLTINNGTSAVTPSADSSDVVIYTLSYSNQGNQDASGIRLTQTLPAGTSFDAAHSAGGWMQVGSSNTYELIIPGTLAAGHSDTAAFAVKVNNPAAALQTQISTTATVEDTGANGESVLGNNSVSDTDTLTAAPDLTITSVVDGRTSAAPGDTVTYTINYANVGNQASSGAYLEAHLPVGTTYSASNTLGWVHISGDTYRLALTPNGQGEIDASGSATFLVHVDDTVAAGLENHTFNASIVDDGANGADTNAGNNSGTDTNDLDATPDLSVVVTSSTPVNVTVDDTIDYTISYANAAGAHNQNASGVHLHFKLPAGTSIDLNDAANTGWSLVGGTTDEYEYAVGSDVVAGAAPGTAGLKLHVNSTAAAGQDDIKLEVSIADDNAGGADSNLLDNTASATHVLDAAPELQLTINNGVSAVTPSADSSDVVIYTLSYSNQGNQDASGIRLTQTLPAGTSFDAAHSAGGWTQIGSSNTYELIIPGTLAAGHSDTAAFAVKVNNPAAALQEQISTTATVSDTGANGESVLGNNSVSDTDTLNAAPDLTITSVVDGRTSAAPGDTVTYTINYANVGNQASSGAYLEAHLPVGTSYSASNTLGWVHISGDTYRLALTPNGQGEIDASGSATFLVHVDDTVDAALTSHTFNVSIVDDGLNGADTDSSNDSGADTNLVIAAPDLKLTVSNGVNEVAPSSGGDVVVYTLDYINQGSKAASGIRLTQTLPAGTSFDADHSTNGWAQIGSSDTYELIIPGALAVGAGNTATFAVTVNSAVAALQEQISTTATVHDTASSGEVLLSDNTATDTDTLVAAPELTITSVVDGTTSVAPGDTVAYTINYANVGNQASSGAYLIAHLPAGTSYSAANVDGWVLQGDGSYHLALSDIDSNGMIGSTGFVTFKVDVDSPVAAGLENHTFNVSIVDSADTDLTNNSGTDTNDLDATPDLSVVVTSSTPVNVTVDDTIDYTISYANAAGAHNQNASGVHLHFKLPAGTSIDLNDAANTGWSLVGGTTDEYEYAVGSDVVAGAAPGTAGLKLHVNSTAAAGQDDIKLEVSIADDNAGGADSNLLDNTASATHVLDAAPELQLSITNGVSAVTPSADSSDVVIYTLNYSNHGNQDASGIRLTQTLPAGTSFDAAHSSSWVETSTPGLYELIITDGLAVDGTGSATFAVKVNNPAAALQTQISTTATVSDTALNGETVTGNNSVIDTDTLTAAPDLTITSVDHGSTSAAPGDTVTYTINYANVGNQASSGAYLEAHLPAGTTYSGSNTLGWVHISGDTYRLALTPNGQGEIDASGSATFLVDVDSPVVAGLENHTFNVSIVDDGANGADTNPGNDSKSDTNDLDATPDLSVVVTSSTPVNVTVDDTIDYTISYANAAGAHNQNASGVHLHFKLPAGTSIDLNDAANTGWTLVGGTTDEYEYAVGSDVVAGAAPGTAGLKLHVNSTAAAGQDDIKLEVSIADDNAGGADSNLLDNTASATHVLDAAPELQLTINNGTSAVTPSADSSDVVIYTLSYSNQGNQDASGIRLTQTLPAGTSFDAAHSAGGWMQVGSSNTYELIIPGTLAAGHSDTAAFAVKVNNPAAALQEQISTTATVEDTGANGESVLGNNSVSDTDTLTAAPDLTITSVVDGRTSAAPGDTVTYTINYANVGNQASSGAYLEAHLPVGTTYSASNTLGWVHISGDTYRLALTPNGQGEIDASGSATFLVHVDDTVAAGLENHTFNASIVDDGANGTDTDLTNNSGTDTNVVDASPDLKVVSVSDGKTSAAPGEELTYTINYSNVGNQDARGVVLTETLPTGTSIDMARNPGWHQVGNTSQYTYTIGDLAATGSGSVKFIVSVIDPSVAGLQNVSNTVSIDDDHANGVDLTPSNNTASDSDTELTAAPDLTITSVVNGAGTLHLGDTVTYTITYANVGNQNATGIVLTETLPAGTRFDPAQNPGWTQVGNTNQYTYHANFLGAGFSKSVPFKVTVADVALAGQEQFNNVVSIADDGFSGPESNNTNNSFTASNPLDAAPDMKLTVSNGVTQVSPSTGANDVVVYTLNYSNAGNQNASGVRLTQMLPVGTSFDAAHSTAGWTETATPGVYELVVNSEVAAFGGTGSATFAVKVDNAAAALRTQISTTATVADSFASGEVLLSDNTATDADVLVAAPELKIVASNNATSVAPGDVVTWKLDYTNIGNQDATGVVITETVPVGTVFDAAHSSAGWVETTPGVYQYTVSGAVAGNGGTGSVNFAVHVNDAATVSQEQIQNHVQITDDGLNGSAPTTDSHTDVDQLNATPDLKIVSVSNGSTEVTVGSSLVYEIQYQNVGNQDAAGVYLEAIVPAGTKFDAAHSAAGWTETSDGSGVYRLNVGALSSSIDGDVMFAVTVDNTVAAGIHSVPVAVSIHGAYNNGDADPSLGNNSATDSDVLVAAPDLSVTSTSSAAGTVNAGDAITYTISYHNSGTQGATGVVLTETLPAGTSIDLTDPANNGWSHVSGSTYSYTLPGELAAGAQGTATFKVVATSTAAAGLGSIENSVSIADDHTNGADLLAGNNQDTDSDVLVAAPDLSVTSTSSAAGTVNAGDAITYTISYHNSGTQGATGVVLTETLPAGTSIDLTDPANAGWSHVSGSTYQYTVSGELAAGAQGSATFKVVATSAAAAGQGSIENSVSITDDHTNGADLLAGNNQDTDSDVLVAAPDLSVTSTSSAAGTVNAGDAITYTISYHNSGTQGATGVVLTETLPAGTSIDLTDPANAGWSHVSGSTYSYTLPGELAAGAQGTATFKVTVNNPAVAGLNQIGNQVSIADDHTNGADLLAGNNQDTDSDVLVAAPDLSVTSSSSAAGTVNAGDAITYTISYRNSGTQGATGVVLTETLPAGTSIDLSDPANNGWSHVSGSTYQYTVSGELAAGAQGTATFKVVATSTAVAGQGSIEHVVSIADDHANGADLLAGNNQDTDSDVLVAAPDLSVTSTSSAAGTVNAGDAITYTISYHNSGTQGATGVVLTETLPAGTSINLNDPANAGWSLVSGNTYQYALSGELAAGAQGTATFKVTVNNPAVAGLNQIGNQVSIADDHANGADLLAGNNQDTDSDVLVAAPDLSVTSTSSAAGTVNAGDAITYTISYHNSGTQGATGVVLTETLPAGTSIDLTDPANNGWSHVSGSTYSYTLPGELAAGAQGTATFKVTVNNPAVAGLNQIGNQVSIADDHTNGADLLAGNNQDTDSDVLVAAPDLSVTSTSSAAGTVNAGDAITYTISYRNSGTQGATGVVLTETLPAGTSINLNDPANAGWSLVSGNTYQYALSGELAAGAQGTATFKVVATSTAVAGQGSIEHVVSIADDHANGADLLAGNNQDTDSDVLVAAPDLSVTSTSSAAGTVNAGDAITYTISYHNSGTQGATGVVLTETLPAGTSINLNDPANAGWSLVSGNTYQYALSGELAAGAQGTATFKVVATSTAVAGQGSIEHVVSIADDHANGADLLTGNNQDTDSDVLVAAPDLSVTSTSSAAGTVNAGDAITYTISYHNSGTQGATGVVLTETLPAGTSINLNDPANAGWSHVSGSTYQYTVSGELAAGAQGTATFKVTVNNPAVAGLNQIGNQVSIADDHANGADLLAGNNQDTDSDVLVAAPDLSVTSTSSAAGTVNAGDAITYTISYHNSGTQGATGVVLTETLPAGTSIDLTDPANNGWSHVSGNTYSYTLPGELAAGAQGTATFKVTVNNPAVAGLNQIGNQVSIADDHTNGADLVAGNNQDTDSDVLVAAPDLSVTSSSSAAGTVNAGDAITYTISYRNSGTQGATGVVLTETLPAGTSINLNDPANAGWSLVSGNTYQYALSGELAAGAQGTATFKVVATSTAVAGQGSIEHVVSIADDHANGADLLAGNNQDTDSDVLVAAPDLSVTSTSSAAGTVNAGDAITYTISYHNSGTQGATGVVLTETLPAGTSIDLTDPANNGWSHVSGNTYQYTVSGELAAGAQGTATFKVVATSTAAAGLGSIENSVSIADDHTNGADLLAGNNQDTDSDVLVAAPDLSVTSTSSAAGTVNAGDAITYTISYHNSGTQGATGVVLTETLPAGTSIDLTDPANNGWSHVSGSTYSYTLPGELAAGAHGTATFKVVATSAAAAGQGSIENSVSIADDHTNGADLLAGNNQDTDSDVLVAAPDLSVTSTSSAAGTVNAGDAITYTISYHNSGTQGATGVVLTETLPAGTSIDLTDPANNGWSHVSGSTYQYTVSGELAAGAQGTATFKVVATSGAAAGQGSIENSVSIADDHTNGADLLAGNNQDTDSDVLVAAPDLSVTSTSSAAGTVNAGDAITYTISYHNSGTQGATGVVLTETLPAGTSIDLTDPANNGWSHVSGNTYQYTVSGELAAGAQGTATFKVVATSAAAAGQGSIENSVSIADDHTNGADLLAGNNQDTDSDVLVAAPDLSVTSTSSAAGTVNAGDAITYTISYHNSGTQGATGVVLTETLPAGTSIDLTDPANNGWSHVSGNTYSYTLPGELAAGAQGTATFKVVATSAAAAGQGSIENSVSIADDHTNGADLVAGNNQDTDSDVLVAAPDLSVTSTSSAAGTVNAGDAITYTISYHNSGTQGATGVVLTETLPAGTSIDLNDPANAGWSHVSGNTYSYTLPGELAAGAQGTATFKVVATSAAAAGQGSIENSVSIADDLANGADLVAGNNQDTDSDVLVAAPDLSVTSTSSAADTVNAGDAITYTISYHNSGTQGATGVVLTETLPAGTSINLNDPANAGWSHVSGNTYQYTVSGELAAGAQGSATFKVVVDGTAPAGVEEVTSSVSITDDGANGADLVAANNATTVHNGLNSAADLHLTLIDPGVTATRGGTVSYTLTYSNTGNQNASGVYLTQHVPAGSTFDAADSAAGWELQPDGSYRLAVGNVAAGAAPQSVVFAVKVDGTVPAGTHALESMASISDDGLSGADANVADNTATHSTSLYQGILAVGRGKGGSPIVRVFNAENPSVEVRSFLAYEQSYKGGISVAVADVNGDGFDDIITATQSGTGRVRVFDGVTGERLLGGAELAPFGKSGRGANLAAGDVNGDGKADIIVGQAYGNQVKVYDGATGALSSTIKAFPTAGGAGVLVAAADLNGDGKADIIAAQKNRVKVFNGATNTLMHNIVPAGSKGNVSIAAGDVTGDGRADLILGSQTATSVAKVSTYTIDTNGVASLLETTAPFGSKVLGAVRVAAVDVNVDGIADIIVAGRSSARVETVMAIDGETGTQIASFNSFGDTKTVPGVVAGTSTLPKVVVG